METRGPILNPAQQEVVDHGLLTSGFSCILQMPTGSGKTWLSRKAIEHVIGLGRRAVYLTPLRALAEELCGRWRAELGEDKVGIFTGDYGGSGREYPVAYKDARVLIMTPERLDACTRTWRSHWSWIPELDLVVVDEVHLLGDAGRGARLEGAMGRLRHLNPFCRFLGLSATLGNRGELADWLGGVEYESSWRPVPLNWRVARYRKADEKPGLLAREVVGVRDRGGQSLVFVQSRRRSEALARHLREQGIGADFHHAGLRHGERRTAEEGFRSNRTSVLVATGTLEMGLNMPARQVVLYDLQAFDGGMFTPLATNTVWQRAGRAGRPGLDAEGEVLLLAPAWDREAQRYQCGRFERIESGLSAPAALAEQILVEVQGGYARSMVQLERVFAGSLAAHQKKKFSVGGAVGEMVEAGMLRVERDEELGGEETVVATRLGRVATRHLLRPASVLKLRQVLRGVGDFTFFDLLVAAASTEDCEPVLMVDFEELEELGDELRGQGSFLFGDSPQYGAGLLGLNGKRLLSALKAALVLVRWSESGDSEKVAEEHGCYPFEILRLRESVDRLLLAAGGVQRLVERKDEREESGEKEEKSEKVARIELLRQMVLNGLDARAASLTLVDGIGAKWARKLIAGGIGDLEGLGRCGVARLVRLGGVSGERAEKWVEASKCRMLNAECRLNGPKIRTVGGDWRGSVDPYRLRRALELKVAQRSEVRGRTSEGEEWIVTGGLEPHRVWRKEGKLVCDCADHANGHECKHVLAVRLASGDAELRKCVERVGVEGAWKREAELEVGDTAGLETCATVAGGSSDYLDVFRLWFDWRGGMA